MKLEKNNNSSILYRIAKSNLLGKKLYSFFSFLTITLAITFVSTLILFLQGTQNAEKRVLDNMQHVIFMNVSEEQMKEMSADPRIEMLIPYKYTSEYEMENIEFKLIYLPSQSEKISTYVPAEGKVPQQYNEIVVDKKFMTLLGKESNLGTEIYLDFNGHREKFIICGYIENKFEAFVYPIYVSEQFSDTSSEMKDIPYFAPVRIKDAQDMEASEFENIVYQISADYKIRRTDININGTFEESLQSRNADLYGILLASTVILMASAVVIYSIFYLSVTTRVQQIGQLQTIGMTQKQVKKMIREEGFLLGSLAILLGLLLGGILVYIIQPEGFSFLTYIIHAVIIGILGMLIVQVSIGKPASVAAKVSPIEAAKNSENDKNYTEKKAEHKRLTAFRLAQMGQMRERKKWWIITVSLALGGIIFMVGATFLASWNEESYSRQDMFKNAEYHISYLYDAHTNPQPYGITDMQLTGHLGEDLKEQLLQIPYIKNIEAVRTVFGNIEYQGNTFGIEFGLASSDSDKHFDAITEGNKTYDYLVSHDAVLVMDTKIVEQLYRVSLKPGDKIKFYWFDGKEHTTELEIAGIAPNGSNSESTFIMADKTAEKLWGEMNTISSFRISIHDYKKNEEKTEEEIKKILNNYSDLSLLTLREKRIEDKAYIQQLNIQIYGIAAFIIMFSILNLINTIISNISTRKKELAMLASIGMEEKQIKQMLLWESVFLILPNIFITLTVGTGVGYAIIVFMSSISEFMEYHFPVLAAGLYIVGTMWIPIIISSICLKMQNKEALVERIKNVD